MIKHDEIPVSENDLSSYGLDTPELAIVVDYTVDMTYDSLRHQEVFRADFKDVYQLYILFLSPQICWGEIEFIPKYRKRNCMVKREQMYGRAFRHCAGIKWNYFWIGLELLGVFGYISG